MSLRRTIPWSTVMHGLHARTVASPYLTADGKFDLSAIMRSALAEARKMARTASGASWRDLLSIWLKHVWAKAKRAAEALQAAHARPAHPSPAETAHQVGRLRFEARQAYLVGDGARAHRLSQEAKRLVSRTQVL